MFYVLLYSVIVNVLLYSVVVNVLLNMYNDKGVRSESKNSGIFHQGAKAKMLNVNRRFHYSFFFEVALSFFFCF